MKFDDTLQTLLTEMPHTASEPNEPFVQMVDFRLETFGKHITYENVVERISETLNSILEEVDSHIFMKTMLQREGKTPQDLLSDIKDRLVK